MRTALVRQGCLEKHADDPAIRQRFVAEAEITGGWSTQAGSAQWDGVIKETCRSDQRDVHPFHAVSPLRIHEDA
jgi:hypothetical protein